MLVSPKILAPYSPESETFVAADASLHGLGAVLFQIQDDGYRKPVAFASRSLTDTEKRYAVIEKEALAATWACEHFADYITGLHFTLETDHKPLVPLLGSTDLAHMPARIQRFKIRLMRYTYDVVHIPGSNHVIPDALSRDTNSSMQVPGDSGLINEVEIFAKASFELLPASQRRLEELRAAQQADPVCSQVIQYCHNGWPAYMPNALLTPFAGCQSHLTVIEDLLLYDTRLVIPSSQQLDILNLVHLGHQGVTKCRAMARGSVWWPGLSKQIEEMVSKCFVCQKALPEPKEPLIPGSFPSRPWERIGMDLFYHQRHTYLIVIDYYSRWIDLTCLDSTDSVGVIKALKDVFATHGLPDIVISDNGPQFSSHAFQEFAKSYCFTHTTSSPLYPRANGEAERAVRTLKGFLKKDVDVHLALLTYRSTPLQNGLSPSELLMGRRLRTHMPMLPQLLLPQSPTLSTTMNRETSARAKAKNHFDTSHRARELEDLPVGMSVWIRDKDATGTVARKLPQPRSYAIDTEHGQLRRNRSALVQMNHTRSGRQVKPPDRLIEQI